MDTDVEQTSATVLAPKRLYGSWLRRLLRGGTTLSDGEYGVLCALMAQLSPYLRETARSQFAEYNMVQREVDKRAINFYRIAGMFGRSTPPSRLIPMDQDEAPLVRIAVVVPGERDLRATLTAVNGQVFCISLDRPTPKALPYPIELRKVVQAWRSNFPGD